MTKYDAHVVRRWEGRRVLCDICLHSMIPVDGETNHPACGDDSGVYGATLGEQLRDDGIAGAIQAQPDAHDHAVTLIKDYATDHEELSANLLRAQFKAAGINGKVVGAAWQTAAKAGLIRAVDYEKSSDPGTHAHPVRKYVSLVYVRRAA